ncbi:unnamed protein product [Parnassius apollo]|uniref:(apollo) hypothetical protein n=1 Tax=Parnassius apollo TaxID=110799 RepID=A0A8S3XIJ3_PARAO|nr:unnamed protein product [Parnassius apollo]
MSSKNRNRIKTLAYSQTDLESALKDIRERGHGIRETCKKYNIPRSTVQDRLRGKRTDILKNLGPELVLGISMEKVLQWIIKIAKCGFPVKKQELLDTVQKILKDYQRPNPFKDDRPGQTWYSGFLKRNPEISSWFMMSSLLTDRIIEECLEQEDSEEENVSEIEDFEEHSDHESGTEQEASDSDGSSVSEESFPSNLQIENTEDEEYLEDVPLKNCEQTGITNQDLVSTRKVIRHLEPVLRKKNVDIKFILREVKKLRKTETRQSEVLYETGSEDRSNSTVHLSTSSLIDSETNLSKANPATITSMPQTVNPVKDSDPASVIDGSGLNNMHYADEQLLPPPIKENILLQANTSKDIAIEGCDKYNVSESLLTNLELKDQEAINNQIISRQDTTENINIETRLTSFYLSCSYLDQGTLVSLDDIVIVPLQSSTPTRIDFQGITSPAVVTLPHVKNKESLTESEKPYSGTEVLFKTPITIEENQL